MSDFSRRRCGLHVAVQVKVTQVTHLNFFVRFSPFLFSEIHLFRLAPQQIQRIDAYLCPMSAALERSKMDDEK